MTAILLDTFIKGQLLSSGIAYRQVLFLGRLQSYLLSDVSLVTVFLSIPVLRHK